MAIDGKLLQEAVNAVQKYGSVTNAAKELGVARKTLSGRYNKAKDLGYSPGGPVLSVDQEIAVDAKLKRLAQEKRETDLKYKELLKLLEKKEAELHNFMAFKQHVDGVDGEEIRVIDNGKPSQSTAIMLLSDIHYEETVDPLTINDLNEYGTEISKTRCMNYFRNGLKLIDMCRSKSVIDTLVLWLGGDLINGYIHDEFIENNALSPIEASVQVFSLMISGIDHLLAKGDFKEIVIVSNDGNHGRTTKERKISTAAQNSFEWMIYNFLAQHYASEPRIKFKLTRGYFNYLDVYGYTLRFHHGHNVRYYGGVGGITIPLNKAIAMWNQAKHADLDVLGHWHQRLSTRDFVINGSVIGYNAYAMSIKASFERPQQSFFLMHPKRGKTVEAPIFVDR